MPLSTEIVGNKGLSGKELKELVLKDLGELLDKDGMFQEYVAFGRVAYEVELRVHLDNFTYPKHLVKTRTKAQGAVEGNPPLASASPDAQVINVQRTREITSPNATRIAEGMPITIQSVQDGKLVTRELRYEKDLAPEGSGRKVQDVDKSPRKEDQK